MPLSESIDDAVVESTTRLSPAKIGVGYVKVKTWTDCCVAAMTATSRFFPAPVLGANVLKNVSEVQVSDSAGDPANVVNKAVADICTVALRIVTDAVSVIASIVQIPNDSGVTSDLNVTFCSIEYNPSVGQLF